MPGIMLSGPVKMIFGMTAARTSIGQRQRLEMICLQSESCSLFSARYRLDNRVRVVPDIK